MAAPRRAGTAAVPGGTHATCAALAHAVGVEGEAMVPGGAGGGGGRLDLPLRIGAKGGCGAIGVMGGNVSAGEAVKTTVPHFVVHLQHDWGIG